MTPSKPTLVNLGSLCTPGPVPPKRARLCPPLSDRCSGPNSREDVESLVHRADADGVGLLVLRPHVRHSEERAALAEPPSNAKKNTKRRKIKQQQVRLRLCCVVLLHLPKEKPSRRNTKQQQVTVLPVDFWCTFQRKESLGRNTTQQQVVTVMRAVLFHLPKQKSSRRNAKIAAGR